jgi:tRNA threonylcarbamoyladenosine biosynthesis protein TsaB
VTLLAIDTSTSWGSLALYDASGVLAEESWHLQRGHDEALFASVERLLALTGVTLASVDRVAVAVGPGSFTGVRIAIAAAQGIARGSGAAMVGVGTLDVIAHPWSAARRRVCAVLPAGRGELCAATYRERAGRWSRTSEILIGAASELARSLRGGALFAGELDEISRDAFERELGSAALFAPRSATPRRAGHLAEIGWSRIEAGEATAPERLEAVYLRPPGIRGGSGELLGEREPAVVAPGV